MLALRTADFKATDLRGRKLSTEDMAERTRVMVSQIQPPIRASYTLGTIDLNGDEAVVTVRQSYSRMQMMAGKPRKVETSVTQDETWIRTPHGWRLRLVQKERDAEWYVDGKRVEPGKPFDPDAPPYQPKSTEPSGKR